MLDSKLILSEEQSVGTSQTDVDSTNTIDLEVEGMGPGTPIRAKAFMREALASDGAATLAIALKSSDDDSTFETHYTSETFAKADASAGAQVLDLVLPHNVQRYVKLVYTLGTANPTAGTIDAYLTID